MAYAIFFNLFLLGAEDLQGASTTSRTAHLLFTQYYWGGE